MSPFARRSPATDRRSFLKSSALVAAPLAAVAAPAAAMAADDSARRLARIEDERAIEAAFREFVRAGAPELPTKRGERVRKVEPDHDAAPPPIEFSDDDRKATVRHPCTVQLAHDWQGDSTIERMARLQGNAAAVRRKPCVILADYRKDSEGWRIASARMV